MVRKTTSKKRASKPKSYKVSMFVKVGPFSTKTKAVAASNNLNKRGVATLDLRKTAAGYFFTSAQGYVMGSSALQRQTVSNLRARAQANNLTSAQFKIKTSTGV